jgi:hypothetical protein
MPLLAALGVFARSPDVGSTIDELVNSRLPVVAERGEVRTGRVRAIPAMMLAIVPPSVGSRVHFVECPSTARIGTRVAAPEPAGSWSLAAAAGVPIRHLNSVRSRGSSRMAVLAFVGVILLSASLLREDVG